MADIVEEPKSEIQQFFSGTNVFLTGVTGFLGHLLIEKLLRTCYINKIYILVRPKNNKDPQDRLNKMFSSPLFKLLSEKQPNFMEKVVHIMGDCAAPNLGLSAEDEEFLIANIDVVIHCAATINLNGPLKRACLINVRSTRDLLLIARRMAKLKSFVYVSTAFSNPNQSLIQEIIYDCHIKGDILISMVENLPESIITSITPQILGEWPNTYSLSKAVAENLFKDYGQNMPICISRPCIVSFTQDDPISGWGINMQSVNGLSVGVGLGAIHVGFGKHNTPAPFLPADNVTNMVITSAWHASKRESYDSIHVINYTPNNMAPNISFGECLDTVIKLLEKHDLYSEKEVGKPHMTFTDSRILYVVLFFLYHYVPAFFVDIYLWCSGKKPRAVKLCRKVDVMLKDMKFYAVSVFNFDSIRLKELIALQSSMDKKLFNMDVSNVVWDDYFLKCIHGSRRYILNEPSISTKALQRHKKIVMVHYTLKIVLYGFLLYLISLILRSLFY